MSVEKRVFALACLLLTVTTGCSEEAPAEPTTPEPKPEAAPLADKDCANQTPVTLKLSAGVATETPWDLRFTYLIEEDTDGVPTYGFRLTQEGRRWQMQRTWASWNKRMTWRGFCWKGAERPERRTPFVHIQVAPICEGSKLMQMGGCRTVLEAEATTAAEQ